MEQTHSCHLMDFKLFPQLSKHDSWFVHFKQRILKMFILSQKSPRSNEYLKSTAAIVFEQRLHKDSVNWFVIHPFSAFRTVWEVYMILMLFVSVIMTPFGAAFMCLDDGTHSIYIAVTCALDCVCCFDIVINFLTGYVEVHTNNIVLDKKKIAKRYIRRFFLIDLLSSLPIDMIAILILMSGHITCETRSPLQFLCLPKLFRVIRLVNYTYTASALLNLDTIKYRAIRIALLYIVFTHWMACLHYMVPSVFLQKQSWIEKITLRDEHVAYQYQQSIFLTMSQSHSLQYGRHVPETNLDIALTMLNNFLGSLFYYVSLVVILHTEAWVRSSTTKYNIIVIQLQEYMRYKQLPMHLQNRILQYYEYRFQRTYFRENMIMSTLSEVLRREIVVHGCARLVQNVPLFSNLPKDAIALVVTCLKSEVYLTNDVIIKCGTVDESMFFLSRGTVAVLTPTGKEMCHLEDGSHFGEIALIMEGDRRVASVLAIEICEVYRLERQDFKKILATYPEFYDDVKRIALERVEEALLMEDRHKLQQTENVYR